MIFIAHYRHGPEDTAIGLGDSEDAALAALKAAYPPVVGKPVEVVCCLPNTGMASLEDAPAVSRICP